MVLSPCPTAELGLKTLAHVDALVTVAAVLGQPAALFLEIQSPVKPEKIGHHRRGIEI